MNADVSNRRCRLIYDRPGTRWFEALPLGNGHLGAMVRGAIQDERIDLSEATCWSGEASTENDPAAGAEALDAIRHLLLAGKCREAEQLSIQHLTGKQRNYGTNLPLGNLRLHFPGLDESLPDYHRELNLDYAIARVTFTTATGLHTREAFASHPHRVFVLRLENEQPGTLDLEVTLDGANNPHSLESPEPGVLLLDGKAREKMHSDGQCGVRFHGRLQVVTDGSVETGESNCLRIRAAGHAVLLLALATDFTGEDPVETCREHIATATPLPYETLRKAHAEDHAVLFHRVSLDLGGDAQSDETIDRRIEAARTAEAGTPPNPALLVLLFQYGRYLLIAASREDSVLPAHLQGVWNDGIACAMGWTCDYHLDINTQMNYWHAETTNLSECHRPLFRWIAERLAPSGRRTAATTYGAPGWCAHTVSNAWGYSAPGWWVGWGLHPTAGAWVASHLAEARRFGGDGALRDAETMSVLHDAARFFVHHLFLHPDKDVLLAGPSVSPENAYQVEGGACNVDLSPTCDAVLIREALEACLESDGVREDLPDDLRRQIQKVLPRLQEFAIGRHGQLQEWFDDREDAIPNHRHTSHLLALYPYAQITPEATPELAEAARVTIRRRHESGAPFEATGWSQGNMLGYHARLHDGPGALKTLAKTVRELTELNLMVFHPALAGAVGNVYEMDGNTGFTAGLAEMLLQSHGGVLRLLPALPPEWPEGRVTRLRARGGFEVDIAWRDGKVHEARIVSRLGGPCRVRVASATLRPTDSDGNPVAFDKDAGADLVFDTAAGSTYLLKLCEA